MVLDPWPLVTSAVAYPSAVVGQGEDRPAHRPGHRPAAQLTYSWRVVPNAGGNTLTLPGAIYDLDTRWLAAGTHSAYLDITNAAGYNTSLPVLLTVLPDPANIFCDAFEGSTASWSSGPPLIAAAGPKLARRRVTAAWQPHLRPRSAALTVVASSCWA